MGAWPVEPPSQRASMKTKMTKEANFACDANRMIDDSYGHRFGSNGARTEPIEPTRQVRPGSDPSRSFLVSTRTAGDLKRAETAYRVAGIDSLDADPTNLPFFDTLFGQAVYCDGL